MQQARPVLLVTTPKGKEKRGEEEVGNILFPYDPGITILHTGFPGVLLVYSRNLDPDEACRLLRTRFQAYVRRVVPCHLVFRAEPDIRLRLESEVPRILEERLEPSQPLRINCVSRGFKLRCSELKARLAAKLRRLGYSVQWKKYEWMLNIESAGNIVVVGLCRKSPKR